MQQASAVWSGTGFHLTRVAEARWLDQASSQRVLQLVGSRLSAWTLAFEPGPSHTPALHLLDCVRRHAQGCTRTAVSPLLNDGRSLPTSEAESGTGQRHHVSVCGMAGVAQAALAVQIRTGSGEARAHA
mmetsp:Transcript_126805/g.189184  ORF Transcript_126805/g.189184 Transcript_126805/m.189184 type:complete len:129 (+) Transcript_126805:269-655(+)